MFITVLLEFRGFINRDRVMTVRMLRPQEGGQKIIFRQLADHVLPDACTPRLAPQSA